MGDYDKSRSVQKAPAQQDVASTITLGGQTIEPIQYDSADDLLLGTCTTVPADTGTGFAKGCILIDTNVAGGTTGMYQNIGTNTSCNFDAIVGSGAIVNADIAAGAAIAYAKLALTGALLNTDLAVPRLTVYQETCPVASFTDNGDATGQLDLSTTIPAGAVVAQATVHAITGFAGDTTATATIGDGTDVDRYNTGTPSVFTTATQGVDMGAVSGTAWHTANATPRVTVTGASDFGLIATEGNGTMVVTIFYYQPV